MRNTVGTRILVTKKIGHFTYTWIRDYSTGQEAGREAARWLRDGFSTKVIQDRRKRAPYGLWVSEESRRGQVFVKRSRNPRTGRDIMTDYMTEVYMYGGFPMRRADIIRSLQSVTKDPRLINRYLQGLELSKPLKGVEPISLKEFQKIVGKWGNPILPEMGSKGRNITMDRTKIDMQEIRQKYISSFSKLKPTKPSREQLARWRNMPDPFARITERDREEAFKKGYII